jgi:hypothetical protein
MERPKANPTASIITREDFSSTIGLLGPNHPISEEMRVRAGAHDIIIQEYADEAAQKRSRAELDLLRVELAQTCLTQVT